MSKRDLIIAKVKEIISRYNLKEYTLRQLYYALVKDLIIENTISQYKALSKYLVYARKNGLIPYNIIKDKTRKVESNISTYYWNWRNSVNSSIESIKYAPSISFDRNLYQDKICLIMLEKQALEGIFSNTLGSMSVLVVCRGYNSLSQLYELRKKLDNEKREINVYSFSDFDPSGLDIERNFREQMNDLGISFNSFKRVALTKEQIEKYNLPYAPTKTSDSRSSTWKAKGVVELDALEPPILIQMIKDCVNENWNSEVANRRYDLQKVLQRRANKLYAKRLKEIAEQIARQ